MGTSVYPCAALALLAALGTAASAAPDLYVIANPNVLLTPEEVRDVFLGEKQTAGTVKLTPVDNTARQTEFLSKVLHLKPAKYEALWTMKTFREGLNPPAVRTSDAEVVNLVKGTPGAVGYVSAPPPGVKVIQRY